MIKEKKTDRRSRYTQMIIKKSLLKLLSNKPLNKIAVSELCLEAELNRSTFYNHFYDVYDVYESIENEFFIEVQKKLDNVKTYDLDEAFFREIIKFVAENSDFMSVIAADFGENSLVKKLVIYVRDKYVTEFSERYPKMQKELLDTLFTYTFNGSIGIVLDWIKQGKQQSTMKIAEYIQNFTSNLVRIYLNN